MEGIPVRSLKATLNRLGLPSSPNDITSSEMINESSLAAETDSIGENGACLRQIEGVRIVDGMLWGEGEGK